MVYFVAFLAAARQAAPLIGHDGLLPADLFLQRVEAQTGSRLEGFKLVPSLFWLDCADSSLTRMAWLGAVLSLLVALGFANAIVMALLWGIYLSFVHIGQDWYGYGWEIQLLETGFLAIFLCPLLDPRPFPRRPPPTAVIWLFRWLIFRIMLGAGLIKIRGDECWRDLTCLYHHYETQPIPNPLSRMLHFMPRWVHALGVVFNHLAELAAPWFVFGPRMLRHGAGLLLLLFQITLVLSGNLSFLNYLTIVPVLACFDDSLLGKVLPAWLTRRANAAGREPRALLGQQLAAAALVILVGFLSIGPMRNLMSSRQAMNASFNRLSLVNTYGAFGSVGRERLQIIFEGTDETVVTDATVWKPYEYRCQPGDPNRRPCVVSPYHYRLDWQVWFAAMSSPQQYPWTLHLVWKLLRNDSEVTGLFEDNPFPGEPPRFVRAQLYRYEFAPSDDQQGRWWTRTLLGSWLPPLSAEDPRLRRFLAGYGWVREGAESFLR